MRAPSDVRLKAFERASVEFAIDIGGNVLKLASIFLIQNVHLLRC